MENYFICKVKYQTTDEQTGKDVKTTGTHLVDALSFTEAENRLIKEMGQVVPGDFTVEKVAKIKLTEIIALEEDNQFWYKAKIQLPEIDEKTAKEKIVTIQVLVHANSIDESYSTIGSVFSEIVSEYEIIAITKTAIIDVFPHE